MEVNKQALYTCIKYCNYHAFDLIVTFLLETLVHVTFMCTISTMSTIGYSGIVHKEGQVTIPNVHIVKSLPHI